MRKLFGYACKLAELGTTCKIWTSNLVKCSLLVNRILAFLEDEGVVVALDLENAAVALAFALGDGVHLVPGFKKLAVLLREADVVGLFHVEMNTGNQASDFFAGLDLLVLEIDDSFALPVHGDRVVCPLAEHEVAAVSVHFADGGVEVVEVAFHDFERGVVCTAVLAAAVTPAGKVLTHVVGGDDVFPFDALGAIKAFAVRIFARLVVASAKVHVLFVEVAATAVDCLLEFAVVDAPHLLARIAIVVVTRCCLGIDFRKRKCCENAKNQSDSAC